MHSKNIYVYESTFDNLLTECLTLMTKGRQTAIDLCLKMAETDDHIKTLPKQNQKDKRLIAINQLEVEEKTYFKYVRIGRYVRSHPELANSSMKQIENAMRAANTTVTRPPKIDIKAEYYRLSGFVEFLRKRMGDDTFNTLYDKYEAANKKRLTAINQNVH